MEAALPLEPTEFDLSVEETGDVSSMTAEQYLSWVRYQAEKLPNWKRVDVAPQVPNRQSKYMPEVVDIVSCPVDCLPSDEWQRELLYSFSELRQTLETLCQDESSKDRKVAVPQMKDHAAWLRFCFASEEDAPEDMPGISNETSTAGQPETATSAPMQDNMADASGDAMGSDITASGTQRAMTKRKRDLAYQLGIAFVRESADTRTNEAGDNRVEEDDAESVDEEALGEEVSEAIEGVWADLAASARWSGATNVEPTTSILLQFDQVLTQRLLALQIDWLEESELTPARGRWLYALLARLEKPLYRETAASIRQLYRRCCALRLQLSQTSAACLNKEDATAAVTFQNQLASLNVLISIAGSYFGQGEEFDAFNRALMQETAEYDANAGADEDEDVEEGNWEEDDANADHHGYDEDAYGDAGDNEGGDGMDEGADEGGTDTLLGAWVPVTMAVSGSQSTNKVNSTPTSNTKSCAMELEEGEEVEAADCEARSSKKTKTEF